MLRARSSGPTWQGSLRDLANIVYQIKRSRASGRLTLRNAERLSIAHLYFRLGKLVHVVGNRGDARAVLLEIREWTRALVRFERNADASSVTLSDEHELLLQEVLTDLNTRGFVALPVVTPPAPPVTPARPIRITSTRVIESNIVAASDPKQLITPLEWQILIEGTRRVSLAVAHLVGPKEAMQVLRDILDDCSSTFPAFASLEIAPSGYLHAIERSQLDRMPRESLLEGFSALISICQLFCSPIIGSMDAHKLMIQALNDVGPALVGLGVFQVDRKLLASKE